MVACRSGAGEASSFAVALCSVSPDRWKQTSDKASQVKGGLTNLLQGSLPGISALENKQGDGSSSQVEQDPVGTSWYLQHSPLTQQHHLTGVQHLGHAWPFLMVRTSEVTLNFHQTFQGAAVCISASVNYHIHGRSDSLGSLAKEMGACLPMQVYFGFCFTSYSRIQGLPGLICLEMALSMAQGMQHLLCCYFNCYFNWGGFYHSPHSLWMITAALCEAVPSPLCPSSF